MTRNGLELLSLACLYDFGPVLNGTTQNGTPKEKKKKTHPKISVPFVSARMNGSSFPFSGEGLASDYHRFVSVKHWIQCTKGLSMVGHSQQDIIPHEEGSPKGEVLQLRGKNCNLDVVIAAKHGDQDMLTLSKLSTAGALHSDSTFWQESLSFLPNSSGTVSKQPLKSSQYKPPFRCSRGTRTNKITGSRLFCLFRPHLLYCKIRRAILTITVKHLKSYKLETVNKN